MQVMEWWAVRRILMLFEMNQAFISVYLLYKSFTRMQFDSQALSLFIPRDMFISYGTN